MAEHLQPELGAALRREAERHTPDRVAMLTRIGRRRAEPARGRWAFSLRPVAAAASVAATIVVGFTGIRMAGDEPTPEPVPAATGSPAPSESGAAPPQPGRTPKGKPTETGRRPDRGTVPTPGTAPVVPVWKPADGFLRSSAVLDEHSAGTWAQGNVTLTTTEPVTELDVVIGVARTGGVQEAGKWTSIPAAMIFMAVTTEKDVLYYRFTLKPGAPLAPGSYVFAAQYTHAAGDRDPSGDNYGAVATAGPKKAAVTGAFPAA
ncbi:hypothetical protein FHR83_006480 [Actinoplanes campanulatus]|uniref:Uncharacterized protein n=1 Tax=Actinoplanes campanulatus TaxID=113559 RepID=A0A7W5AME6_9ACTN|nr:hypothetical protein [Actinoplanes campanulatus]MBB3098781.1 hypothetical protein [Actinoplanes campanulatus]GGN37074.1 hypothetical protein GCM10010109_62660 [Actinoplanes campanulatus]GID40717.1 hypothetical protein Aca09nite_72230 [Actinoplanes campanulatus]